MSTRYRLSKLLDQKLKSHYREIEEAFVSSEEAEYFAKGDDRDFPLFVGSEFSALDAWWLAELCHLVYTPDSKEFARLWNTGKADRLEILEQRTPFKELLDVHKTGNHASIYEVGVEGTVVCFRGTNKLAQWISNAVYHPHEWERYREEGEGIGSFVHSGFYVAFKRIWPKIWPSLRLAPRPWVFTGHSLGGALAMLAHAAVKADQVYTFGAPRVGNQRFVDSYLEGMFRVVNGSDIVPLLPAKDKSMGDKEFVHGGKFTYLAEGGLADSEGIAAYREKQPWDILEEWASLENDDLFRHRPNWVKHHSMASYCERLECLL